MRVSVIIPAAGASRRFGDRCKLQQDLGGRPLLLRTVECFTKRDEVTQVVVAGPPDDLDAFKDRFGAALSFHGVSIVAGGSDHRWQSVKAAIEGVDSDADRIAVHDAARPAVGGKLIEQLLLASETLPAVVPGIRVTATMKIAESNAAELGDEDAVADAILGEDTRATVHAHRVERTIPRDGLWEIQTPQVFDADLLRRAYAQADLEGCSDDAVAVERLGESVHVIEGDATNIKVTRPRDLELVRSILGIKPEKARPLHKQF